MIMVFLFGVICNIRWVFEGGRRGGKILEFWLGKFVFCVFFEFVFLNKIKDFK